MFELVNQVKMMRTLIDTRTYPRYSLFCLSVDVALCPGHSHLLVWSMANLP
jgi:hypothetical protein